MRKYLFVTAFLMFAGILSAQSTTWNFDKAHSSVEFDVDHMVISEVHGKFTSFDGTVKADKEDFSDMVINFTIDPASIDTDNDKRDDHLRSADFFDTAKFPKMEFKSSSFEKVSGKKYKLKGSLTMHGVTKPVELDVKFGGVANDPWGNTKAGFKLSGELNRTDFGLTWNNVLETGGLLVGEEVRITARIELAKAK